MNRPAHRGRRKALLTILCASLALTSAALAYSDKPKFGADAVPIQRATDYLRSHAAPDYWAISPFYIAQQTDSDCSVASIAILLNALRGVPERADQNLVTPRALLSTVGSKHWKVETASNGAGVTFAEFKTAVALSLHKYNLDNYRIEVFRPANTADASLSQLQSMLAENERSDADIALAYFNQGVLTGDWDGPHISPIGAYDADNGRVLIMDVDRRYYVPYWSPMTKFLQSMTKPAPRSFGPLAGETGGIVWVRPERIQ
jgi:Phytochelatin synthase